MRGNGFLAIWSDVEPGNLTDYLHWLTREHTSERVGVAGFLAVRAFRALGTGVARFFILYELDGPQVLSSADYLARLNAPSPWTQRIMPTLANFVRGGGRMVAAAGIGRGGVVSVTALEEMPENGAALAADIAALDHVAALRLLQTDLAGTAVKTREKSMRAQDRTFGGLLIIEALDEAAAKAALARLPALAPALKLDPGIEVLLYAQIFDLDRASLG